MRPAKLYRCGDLKLTIQEAADYLNLKEDTLRKRIRRSGVSTAKYLKDKLGVKISHTTGD